MSIDDDLSNAVDIYNKPEYYYITKNNNIDLIAERYKINVNSPIANLSNNFLQAYELDNINNLDDNLYAAVTNQHYPTRLAVINQLKKNIYENLNCPIECEITTISSTKEQNLVIILPKPRGKSLRDFVKNYGNCTPNFIGDYILSPIALLIRKLENVDIIHGKINPDNIFIDEKNIITVGECVTEACGFAQAHFYETIERMECINIGKNNIDKGVDFFALGVLVFFLFTGREPVVTDQNEFQKLRLEQGSYRTITSGIIMPPSMKDLIKGLLNDTRTERWSYKQIYEWINSKRYILPAEKNIEVTKYLIFNERRYSNFKVLAFDLHKYWDLSKKFLKEDKLLKWVETGASNINIFEKLTQLTKTTSLNMNMKKADKDEFIIKTLAIIDPTGPARTKDISITLEGIGNLIAFGYAENKNDFLDCAFRIISLALWKGFLNVKRYEKNSQFNNLLMDLDNCKKFIEIKASGFGLERCLYELNKFFPCQSKSLNNEYIITVPSLLLNLETQIKDNKEIIIDRHITAFIMSRVELELDKIIAPIKNFPDFYSNKDIANLAILSVAQKESGIKKMLNLSKVMASKLSSVAELLYNKKNKEKFQEEVDNIANEGSLLTILKLVLDPDYIKKDNKGFQAALARYKILESQKKILKDEEKIYEVGYRYGLKLTVIISYLLCTTVVLMLIFES